MAKVSSVLQERFKKKPNTKKITAMAKRSSEGSLSSFEGIFSSNKLSEQEELNLESILNRYQTKSSKTKEDLKVLSGLTSEIKAITKQAILLHGERIEKAQSVLKSYQEGAFTAWLVNTYGNRQTPYNLLQYYQFFNQTPSELKPNLELIPRQAVYTLASRQGELEKKLELVRTYAGETKNEVLQLIRQHFPLQKEDRRRGTPPALQCARQLLRTLNHPEAPVMDVTQRREVSLLLRECLYLIEKQEAAD